MLRLMSSEAPGKRLAIWILGFSAFVIAAIIAHGVWFYEQQREHTIDRALTDAQNLASALEEHTRSTVQWTSYSLDALSADIEEMVATNHATTANLRRVVETANRETPEVASFVFASEDGTVISETTASETPPVNIANERYFHIAKARQEGGVYAIAPPWPSDGAKMVIALVHPIRGPNGAFAGAAIGTVDPRLFNQIHAQLDLGDDSTVAVFSREGIMIARAPYIDHFIGTSFADDPVFRDIAQSFLHGGHYNPKNRDGRARFVAYRTMPDYPLVVALGKAESEVLNALHANRSVMAIYVAVLVVLIALFAVWMLALARKQERSHQQLVATFDNVNQGVVVFDSHMRIVSFNQQCTEMFDFPPGFIRSGLGYLDIVRYLGERGEYAGQQTDDVVASRVDGVAQGQEQRRVHHRPNGKVIVIYRKPMAGGGFIITFTDVTEDNRIREEAEERARQLSLVLGSIQQGIRVFDKDLKLVLSNRQVVETFGYPEEFARPGVSYESTVRISAEKGEYGKGNLEDMVAARIEWGRDGINHGSVRMTPSGRYVKKQRDPIEGGGFVSTYTDVTDLVHAELEAARKSELLETVLGHMSQGIVVCDSDLRLVAFNAQFMRLLGYEPDDMQLGMSYEDILRLAASRENIKTDDLDSFIASREQSAQSREPYRKEFQSSSGRFITLRRTPMPDGGFVTTVVDVTNRKKAEMALQASEERYRSLVTSSTQLIWSTDASGKVVEPMPTWQRFTGQSDEDVLGWGWIKAVHADDVERIRASWLAALESKTICNYEYRLRRHDGIYRTFSVRGVPVLNSDGSVREWVGVSEDITERKEAEAEVGAKSRLLEATLQNMAQGITVYDQDFKLVAFNQRYVDLFDFPAGFVALGRSREDILRHLAPHSVSQANPDAYVARRMAAAQKGESFQREFTRANGQTLFIGQTAMPDGGFINTFTDITDRKRAEQALQDSEERLRAILDNIADAIITTDKAGLIQSCNLAAATIFGYSPEEAIGMDIRRLIPNPVFQPRNQAVSGIGPSETMACRKNGALFPIDIAVTSVELAGRWLQIAIVRDIGEQKVLQAQLFQASKLATLGEMAAAMAHEMNQPLNVMRMAADNGVARIDRKLATEEYLRQNLGLISTQAERLGKLIMHMRVFSRVDPTEFELFDPRASVAAAVELMGQQLALNNITVSTAFPADCGEVLGLPSQLEQVIINLLSNAQDAIVAHPRSASPTCVGAITLSMAEGEGMVRIKVADTGNGIPPDVIGRVFDPFFTTKDVGKGTGLGLSVSYGIIAAMGGKIDVFSSSNGAEFTVILPLRQAYGARDRETKVGS